MRLIIFWLQVLVYLAGIIKYEVSFVYLWLYFQTYDASRTIKKGSIIPFVCLGKKLVPVSNASNIEVVPHFLTFNKYQYAMGKVVAMGNSKGGPTCSLDAKLIWAKKLMVSQTYAATICL